MTINLKFKFGYYLSITVGFKRVQIFMLTPLRLNITNKNTFDFCGPTKMDIFSIPSILQNPTLYITKHAGTIALDIPYMLQSSLAAPENHP